MTSVASSAQLSAVSRQIEQTRDLNRQLLNTIRWELNKVKSAVEHLQGLHGKVNQIHGILKRLEAHQHGIQPLSSIHRFREQHSQTPPKSPTSEAGTQFNDQDGKTDFKPDASEYGSEEEFQPGEYELGKAEEEEAEEEETEL